MIPRACRKQGEVVFTSFLRATVLAFKRPWDIGKGDKHGNKSPEHQTSLLHRLKLQGSRQGKHASLGGEVPSHKGCSNTGHGRTDRKKARVRENCT
jgi:hypothetical protein